MTRDHKPNDSAEREHVEALGGSVEWFGDVDLHGRPLERTGVYRINGNLALSRAVGDRAEKPWVTSVADVAHHPIEEGGDSFILLATDGLFDVMTSQEAVTFVNEIVESTVGSSEELSPEQWHEMQRDVANRVVEEALRRGSSDNITVLILWLEAAKGC